jgi:site-specific recombinase XerD
MALLDSLQSGSIVWEGVIMAMSVRNYGTPSVERAGSEAKLAFKAHPHMLRHACGFTLANKGHDTRALQAYLGHRNIQHTVRYTELSPTRFKDFWRD